MPSRDREEDPGSEELLARFSQGDDSALGHLVEKEAPHLFRRLARKLPPQVLRRFGVSDIVQQTSIELLAVRDQFENRGYAAFKTLLNRIADGLLLNAVERERADRRNVLRQVDVPPEALSADPVDGGTPYRLLIERERVTRMKRCLDRLANRDREVIELVDYDGLSHREVAARLKISPEAARKRYSRALDRLRGLMREDGLVED